MWRRRNPPVSRLAFTLLELLVVIVILAVLAVLLLVAIQACIETARRAACMNNFRQVGLAMHAHHSARQRFPVGEMYWGTSDPTPAECGYGDGGPYYSGWGWSTYLLPYLDQQPVWEELTIQFEHLPNMEGTVDSTQSQTISCKAGAQGDANRRAMARRIEVFQCPSDPQANELVAYTPCMQNGPHPNDDVATTNMAVVVDSVTRFCPNEAHSGLATRTGKDFGYSDGMFGNYRASRIENIADGLSRTLMLSEVAGQGTRTRNGYSWAFTIGLSTSHGVNSPHSGRHGRWPGDWWDPKPASHHPAGCHFALADGSVVFLSNEIDAAPLAGLTTRAGGESYEIDGR